MSITNMNVLIVLPVLISAALGAPPGHVDYSKLEMDLPTMDEIEGAPQHAPGSRIISGNEATRGQFPFLAGIITDNRFCGGSILSNRWILTSARCANGGILFTVYLGVLTWSDTQDERQIRISTTNIIHSGYNPKTFYNDIALLYLSRDIIFTTYIQPVTLASGSATYVGSTARVSGWGITYDEATTANDTLYYVDIPVISNTECAATYGSSNVVSTTLCTSGAGGKGPCNGDTGGPLVAVASGRQIGIVSFVSSSGCSSGAPSAYTRLTSFDRWIAANTGIII